MPGARRRGHFNMIAGPGGADDAGEAGVQCDVAGGRIAAGGAAGGDTAAGAEINLIAVNDGRSRALRVIVHTLDKKRLTAGK